MQGCSWPLWPCINRPWAGIVTVLSLSGLLLATLLAKRASLHPAADPDQVYAHDWAYARNPAYADYTCHDCANFVSQCLIASGYTLSGGVDGHGCIPSCDNLASWLNSHNSDKATVQEGGTVPGWVGPGAVAIFGSSTDPYMHATFVVDGHGSSATLAAHCRNHCGEVSIGGFLSSPDLDRVTFWMPSPTPRPPDKRMIPEPVSDNANLLSQYCLFQNYPNPFNEQTIIGYYLPEASHVVIAIYDGRGREVRRIVDGTASAGHHETTWDGRNELGQAVATGLYFCKFRAAGVAHTVKVLLLR